MTQCINFPPSEQIRVFISSAQSNENGFDWSDVRRQIKNSLRNCVYLNPFIIEDEASPNPSLQFFQRQVARSDVMILLIKGEVRFGTAKEFALASKLKKPLLVYFIKDDNPTLDVVKLRNDIQAGDICTYRPLSSFDDIGTIIRSDLMNNIVRTFQDNNFVSSIDNENSILTEIHEDTIFVSSGIPSKTECY